MERTRRDQLFFFWFMPLFSLAFCIAAWLVGQSLTRPMVHLANSRPLSYRSHRHGGIERRLIQ